MRPLNGRQSLICIAAVLCGLAVAVMAGCGGSSAADPLDMLLDDTVGVFAYDMGAIAAGEAGDTIADTFEDYWDSSFGSIGILMNEAESLTVGGRAQDIYAIMKGEFDFEYVRDELDDQDYDDDDYRGFELWTGGPRREVSSVALIEDAGVVLAGDHGAVEDVLRNLARELTARDGAMQDTLRAMGRAGDGWVVIGVSECPLRGCEAFAYSIAAGDRFEYQFTEAVLFRNERTAESQLDEVEDKAEEGERGTIFESVTLDGEFVIVVRLVDEDDFADGARIELGSLSW